MAVPRRRHTVPVPPPPRVIEATPRYPRPAYEPTLLDVIVARALLEKGLRLPAILVADILDEAQYWPHSTSRVSFPPVQPLIVRGSSEPENRFLLRCHPVGFLSLPKVSSWEYRQRPLKARELQEEHQKADFEAISRAPLPELLHPVRKIVFTLKSHDQGWAGARGAELRTYRSSYTWFEVGLERFDALIVCPEACEADPRAPSENAPPLPLCSLCPIYPELIQAQDGTTGFQHKLLPDPNHLLQRNLTAVRDWNIHEIVWSYTDHEEDNLDPPPSAVLGDPHLIHLTSVAEFGRASAAAAGKYVRSLKLGDVPTLWAMARFPNWLNIIESANVEIYWAL